MPPSSKPLELDAGWVFWRSFFLVFLVFECLLWHGLQQWPGRPAGHRMIIFLVRSRGSVFPALLLAGACTVLAILIVKLIVGPLLNRWLNPAVDPSWWLFHLSASDSPVASTSGRWYAGGRWQPGALVLTNRRIWFFPAGWSVEPWSLAREDLDRIETDPPHLARVAPIRNWPEWLRLGDRNGEHAWFAVADPDAVLAWFGPPARRDGDTSSSRIAPQGAFDV
jgi:hypothetical protein